MTHRRIFNFQKAIDNNYMSDKGSVVLPSNVRRIVSICPNMVNGKGFVSIFSEIDEECLLNQMGVADDNAHFNKKNIEVFSFINSNLYYVLQLTETDISQPCTLKIFVTYEEEDIDG